MSTNLAFASCRPETAVSRQTAVERLILAMRQRVNQPMSLQWMAQKAMVSSSHLDHIFRQATGISPRRFIGALRLTSAKRMLLNTELRVIDICLATGYNSLGTFTRRFTELVGVPPLHLRRLPENGMMADMRSLRRETTTPAAARHNDFRGCITAPSDFSGLIFVGLFDGPIPEGRPARCAVLSGPGSFTIHGVPDQRYYVFAMGFRWSEDPLVYLRNDTALRASAHPQALNAATTELRLHLRPPEVSDPPILVAIPALVALRFAQPHRNELLV